MSPELCIRDKQGRCIVESTIRPMPGDLVCVTKSDDVLIEEGSCGVIEGVVGEYRNKYPVLFNPSPLPWWDRGIVNSSGGPEREIKSRKMTSTGEKRKQQFQYFPHGIMGANLAKTRTREVNIFKVDLTEK